MRQMIDRLTGEMSFPNRLISEDKVSYWFLRCRLLTLSRSHNPQERVTPILGLRHGRFHGPLYFLIHVRELFPANMEVPLRGLFVSQEGWREGKISARSTMGRSKRGSRLFSFSHLHRGSFFNDCCFIEIHLIARLSLDPIDRSPFGHLVKFTQRSFLLY